MTLSFAFEPLDDLLAEGAEDLMALNWQESGEPDLPFAPDWPALRQLERDGIGRIMAARRAGVLIGYASWYLVPHKHSRSVLLAVNDALYVAPEERGTAGLRLIFEAERALKALGARFVVYETKVGVALGHHTKSGTVGDVLTRLGYVQTASTYTKRM